MSEPINFNTYSTMVKDKNYRFKAAVWDYCFKNHLTDDEISSIATKIDKIETLTKEVTRLANQEMKKGYGGSDLPDNLPTLVGQINKEINELPVDIVKIYGFKIAGKPKLEVFK